MKRVLIAGAAGFLGSHLCDRFIAEGHHVIGVDNLITGDLRNIEHLTGLDRFEFHTLSQFIHVKGDLGYILHFASASPIDYLKMHIQTLKVGSSRAGASASPRPKTPACSSRARAGLWRSGGAPATRCGAM